MERTTINAVSLKAYVLLIITTFCWGANVIFGKLAVGEVSPMTLVALRWAGVVLLVVVTIGRDIWREWPRLKQHWPFFLLMGSAGFTLFNSLYYAAAHTTSGANLGILQGAIPVFVMLLGFVIFGHRITLVQMIGVLVTLIGVVLVATGGELRTLLELSFVPGDLFMLLACFCYAAYAQGLTRKPPVKALEMFGMFAVAAFFVSLPMVGVEVFTGSFQAPTSTGWWLILGVVLFPSFIAQIFFIKGVELIGPARAGVFINLVPIFAALLVVIILDETFEVYHSVALALVLGGIFVAEMGKAKPA